MCSQGTVVKIVENTNLRPALIFTLCLLQICFWQLKGYLDVKETSSKTKHRAGMQRKVASCVTLTGKWASLCREWGNCVGINGCGCRGGVLSLLTPLKHFITGHIILIFYNYKLKNPMSFSLWVMHTRPFVQSDNCLQSWMAWICSSSTIVTVSCYHSCVIDMRVFNLYLCFEHNWEPS